MGGNRRTIVSIVAVALLIALLGACGSSSKPTAKARARTAAQAKAARAKVAAAKRRLAAAKVRVAAQRRALAAVVRRRQLRARAAARAAAKRAASTTTTTAPQSATPTTVPKPGAPPPSTPAPPPTPVTTVAGDVAAIQQTIDTVNAAFAKGVAAGIAASEFANYYVSAGVYSEGECSAFEAARGLGVVADRLVVRSVTPTPGWVDPILRGVPKGRVYGLTMDDIQTQIVTKQTRTQTVTTHATVGAKGRAQLFFRCR